jgi:hypothetical protein
MKFCQILSLSPSFSLAQTLKDFFTHSVSLSLLLPSNTHTHTFTRAHTHTETHAHTLSRPISFISLSHSRFQFFLSFSRHPFPPPHRPLFLVTSLPSYLLRVPVCVAILALFQTSGARFLPISGGFRRRCRRAGAGWWRGWGASFALDARLRRARPHCARHSPLTDGGLHLLECRDAIQAQKGRFRLRGSPEFRDDALIHLPHRYA